MTIFSANAAPLPSSRPQAKARPNAALRVRRSVMKRSPLCIRSGQVADEPVLSPCELVVLAGTIIGGGSPRGQPTLAAGRPIIAVRSGPATYGPEGSAAAPDQGEAISAMPRLRPPPGSRITALG